MRSILTIYTIALHYSQNSCFQHNLCIAEYVWEAIKQKRRKDVWSNG